jgi:hypothetical protein
MGLISNGSTIFDNGSMASGFGGSLVFLSKQTASSSSTVNFTSGIDSTYKEYLFTFNNIHASANSSLGFKASSNGGSSYGIATTTTAFMAEQAEGSDDPFLGYRTGDDHAQSTGLIRIGEAYGTDNDQSGSGYMHLFNPSSTTFVKHFLARNNSSHPFDYTDNAFKAGYINTTSSINAIQFAMTSGNIDAGDICLYGIA